MDLTPVDTQLIARLRADLHEAGYSATTLHAWFATDVRDMLTRGVSGPARNVQHQKRVSEPNRRHLITLIDLFVVGDLVTTDAVNAALPTLTVEGARELGIISQDEQGRCHAALSVSAHESWLVISDLDDHLRRSPAAPDHVMGVGGATRSLIDAIPHNPVDRACEIGTGCGVVALELSRIAHHVVATDVSHRALQFAEMNLLLNEVTNVELRLGDLTEPLGDETYDLVVSNPPFVISPVTDDPHYTYRTSGEPGDALFRRLTAKAPSHLAEGGTLVCLANWEHEWGSGQHTEVLDALVPGPDTTAWLIERGRQTPIEYASLWLRDGGLREHEQAYADALEAWITDFHERNVSHVCFGYLMVRNTPGVRLTRTEQVSGTLGNGVRFGDAWFDACEGWLATQQLDDARVLVHHFELVNGIEEIRTMIPGTEDITAIMYVQRHGIERFENVDTFSGALLGASDGELTTGEIAHALAELLDIHPEVAESQAVAYVREYVYKGLLRPSALD